MNTIKPKKKKSLLKKILTGLGIFIVFIIIMAILFPLDYYELGLNEYNKKNYSEALTNFKNVEKNDKNHESALIKIVETNALIDSLEKLSVKEMKDKNESILLTRKKLDSLSRDSADKHVRQKIIEAQFSPWDGSHIKLENYIKQNMNDPDSYEHISTDYWTVGDHLLILTKYRGKNAFGGKVIGITKAKVDLEGNILKIIEEI